MSLKRSARKRIQKRLAEKMDEASDGENPLMNFLLFFLIIVVIVVVMLMLSVQSKSRIAAALESYKWMVVTESVRDSQGEYHMLVAEFEPGTRDRKIRKAHFKDPSRVIIQNCFAEWGSRLSDRRISNRRLDWNGFSPPKIIQEAEK